MQANIIREYKDFLLLLLRRISFLLKIVIKIRVIVIEVILININLVYNSNLFNNCGLSKVQILIINISGLTFSSLFVNLTINIEVKILNQLSYFLVNIMIKMLIQIRSKTLSKYLASLCKSPHQTY